MNSAWNELLTTDVGVMSLIVIAGVCIIAVTLALIVRRKMRETP